MSTFAMLRPELCLKEGKSPSFTSLYFIDLRTCKKRTATKRTDSFFSQNNYEILMGWVKKRQSSENLVHVPICLRNKYKTSLSRINFSMKFHLLWLYRVSHGK